LTPKCSGTKNKTASESEKGQIASEAEQLKKKGNCSVGHNLWQDSSPVSLRGLVNLNIPTNRLAPNQAGPNRSDLSHPTRRLK